MKIIIYIISLALIIATLTSKSFAQGVVISANESATPAASAMLDVQSTDKGLLIPRMDSTQRVAISTPATGLLVYQTDKEDGFYFFNGTDWINLNVSTSYSVGDFAHGGIVFWVDETGQHGLVAAKQDQSTGVRWFAGFYGHTQAKGDGPYAGEANTSIIIAAHVAIGDDGNTYAARICNELQVTEGGKTYGDWYLPSKEELNLMYQNKATIDATAGANGGSGFAFAFYWSSSELFDSNCWGQSLGSGSQGNQDKNFPGRVRAVRAF